MKVLGTSASRSFGDVNLSVEASVRDKMPLRSGEMLFGFNVFRNTYKPFVSRSIVGSQLCSE